MSYNQLTKNDRYQIYALIKAKHTQKYIAQVLGRSASTIRRELRRNRGLRDYRPKQADKLFEQRRCEAHKACKVTDGIRDMIEHLIRQDLSPQQVAGYLERHQGMSLHHETIFQIVLADKANGGDLYTHLRVASKPNRKRYGHYDRRGTIKNRVSIDERPPVVEGRRRVGDWEGNTIIRKGCRGALLTMVERMTLYTVIAKLPGKKADTLADAAVESMAQYRSKVKTITLDNGLEFAEHEVIAAGRDGKI